MRGPFYFSRLFTPKDGHQAKRARTTPLISVDHPRNSRPLQATKAGEARSTQKTSTPAGDVGHSAQKAAAQAERARWATVFQSEAGKSNRATALVMLSETEMPAASVVNLLTSLPRAAGSRSRYGMASEAAQRAPEQDAVAAAGQTARAIVVAYHHCLGISSDAPLTERDRT